jgi:hypothetical protein
LWCPLNFIKFWVKHRITKIRYCLSSLPPPPTFNNKIARTLNTPPPPLTRFDNIQSIQNGIKVRTIIKTSSICMKGASSHPLMDLGKEWITFRITSTHKQTHFIAISSAAARSTVTVVQRLWNHYCYLCTPYFVNTYPWGKKKRYVICRGLYVNDFTNDLWGNFHWNRLFKLQNFFFFFLIFPYAFFRRRIFSFLLMDPFRHLAGLLGWGISPAPRLLPTQHNTTHRNTDTHPCPEQDSKLRSQCSSCRRQYLP